MIDAIGIKALNVVGLELADHCSPCRTSARPSPFSCIVLCRYGARGLHPSAFGPYGRWLRVTALMRLVLYVSLTGDAGEPEPEPEPEPEGLPDRHRCFYSGLAGLNLN
jgi:hypothetical protein